MNKLSQEELQNIKLNQQRSNEIIFALGEIALQKEGLIEQYKNVISEQNELGKSLTEKYGDGKIDLNTGELLPIEEEKSDTPITP